MMEKVGLREKGVDFDLIHAHDWLVAYGQGSNTPTAAFLATIHNMVAPWPAQSPAAVHQQREGG